MKICDECETVAHCTKHGCIPKVSAKDAMKLALEALEGSTDKTLSIRAMIALQEALAQPQQEPVGFMNAGNILEMQQKSLPYAYVYPVKSTGVSVAVYTSPPAERRPLTREVIERDFYGRIDFVRLIEAAHNIKENT